MDTTVVTALGAFQLDMTKFTVVRRSLVTGRLIPSPSIFTVFRNEDDRIEAENTVLEVIPREFPVLNPA